MMNVSRDLRAAVHVYLMTYNNNCDEPTKSQWRRHLRAELEFYDKNIEANLIERSCRIDELETKLEIARRDFEIYKFENPTNTGQK
jgi:flagellar motor switch protein FliM